MNRRNALRTIGIGTAGAGLLPLAAAANTPRTLRMVTSWPAGFPGLGTSAHRVARRLEAATGGQLKIQVYAAGERVGPFEVFEAVASGEADLYHSADYYRAGEIPAYNFFTAIPFGMTAVEMAGWLVYGGGQTLWDELSAPLNIKPLMCTNTGTQMGGWFNREIRTVDDFDGLRIRMPGLGGVALAQMGAVVRNVAGGEIYAALKDGNLDAAEWVGPWNDLAAGMHEVADHYYYPGFHEPGGSLALGVNLDVWQSLGDQEQRIFEEVTSGEYIRSLTEFNVRNAAALTVLRDEHGITPKPYSDDVLSRIAASVTKTVAELGNKDPMTRKVYESYSAAKAGAMQWSAIGEEAFLSARRQYDAR